MIINPYQSILLRIDGLIIYNQLEKLYMIVDINFKENEKNGRNDRCFRRKWY